jgi:hypothetical protein
MAAPSRIGKIQYSCRLAGPVFKENQALFVRIKAPATARMRIIKKTEWVTLIPTASRAQQFNFEELCCMHTEGYQEATRSSCLMHPEHRIGSASTLSCTVTISHPVARVLHQLCRASGRAVSPLDFPSVARTGSRSASSHYFSVSNYSSSGLHRLYCVYAVHPDAPSRRSTSRRSLTLALAVHPVTASRGATTRRLDCTGSTAPMPCIQTRHLDARLLVGRSQWLSQCVRSLLLATRLLVVRIAPALLRLCRASGREV